MAGLCDIARPRLSLGLRLLRSRTARQTLSLSFAQMIAIPLGIVTSAIITRVLGPEDYGILAFYGTIIGFALLFFRFGFSSSAGLLVAHEDDEGAIRRIVGVSVGIFVLIGASYSLFIFALSFVVDNVFDTSIRSILTWAAVPLMAAPFSFLITSIAQGTNRIHTLASYQIAQRVISALGVLVLFALAGVNVTSLIALGLGNGMVCTLFVIARLRPSFEQLKVNAKTIWRKNREYGIHLYFGQIADQSTFRLGGIFIGYFANTTQLGFFALANMVTLPMVILSRALSMSLFRGFAKAERIPRKVISLNLVWLIGCVAAFGLFGKYAIVFLFSERFLPVARLVIPLSLAAFFQGAYQPYNMFLGATGRGKWLRNMSFVMSAVNVGANVALVPMWGAMGACIASILGNLTFYISCVVYYNRHLKEAADAGK